MGGQTVFTKENEELFVRHIIKWSQFGFPITKYELRCTVTDNMYKSGRIVKIFKHNIPQDVIGQKIS